MLATLVRPPATLTTRPATLLDVALLIGLAVGTKPTRYAHSCSPLFSQGIIDAFQLI
jgi:hypothetical protein